MQTIEGIRLNNLCAQGAYSGVYWNDGSFQELSYVTGADSAEMGLRELAAKHPSVGEVRGLGVFWAIELVTDQQTREPLAPYGGSSPGMAATLAACKSGGLLPFSNYNRIHACPPCNVSDTEIADGLQILDAALTVADGYAS